MSSEKTDYKIPEDVSAELNELAARIYEICVENRIPMVYAMRMSEDAENVSGRLMFTSRGEDTPNEFIAAHEIMKDGAFGEDENPMELASVIMRECHKRISHRVTRSIIGKVTGMVSDAVDNAKAEATMSEALKEAGVGGIPTPEHSNKKH